MARYIVRLERALDESEAMLVAQIAADKLGQNPDHFAKLLIRRGRKPITRPMRSAETARVLEAFEGTGVRAVMELAPEPTTPSAAPFTATVIARPPLRSWRKGTISGLLIAALGVAVLGAGFFLTSQFTGARSRTPAPAMAPTPPGQAPDANPTPPLQSQHEPGRIVITDVARSGDQVIVTGESDLPGGAEFVATLELANQAPDDLWLGTQQRVTVQDGLFTANLPILDDPTFRAGPHHLRIRFHPRNQEPRVLEITGAEGQHLIGDLREECYSWTCLVLIRDIALDLVSGAREYLLQRPEELQAGSPEYVLASYIAAWAAQDFRDMARHVQPSWSTGPEKPHELLAAWHDYRRVRGFKIEQSRLVGQIGSATFHDITYVITYAVGPNNPKRFRVTARLVHEGGRWGVNPTSTLKENLLPG